MKLASGDRRKKEEEEEGTALLGRGDIDPVASLLENGTK